MGFGANVLCIWMCSPLENVSCLLHSSPSSHPSFLIVVSFSDTLSVSPLCRAGLIFSVWKQSSLSTVCVWGGDLHMARIEWYSSHTVILILILSFISSPPPSPLMLDWTAWYSPHETHTEGWDAETQFVDFPFWHLYVFIYFILIGF